MSKFDIATASMADLLAFFNSKSATPVKRFADRKTAERRVLALLGDQPATIVANTTLPDSQEDEPRPIETAQLKDDEMAKKTPKPKPKGNVDRSKAVAKSWKDAKVAKARSTHNKVSVAGTIYRSARDAFTQLKLPAGSCISFRSKLKKSGVETFTTEDGKKYNFKIVKGE